MKGVKEKRTQVNFKYLEQKFRENGVTQTEASELLGKAKTYLSYGKKHGLTDGDIEKLVELFGVNAEELMADNDVPNTPNTPNGRFEDYVIAELGQIQASLKWIKDVLGEPRITAVPMKPEDMADLILDDLISGGVCTKDDVIIEFNKHKIPIQYLQGAVERLGVTRTTSGHAEGTRTYYIKTK